MEDCVDGAVAQRLRAAHYIIHGPNPPGAPFIKKKNTIWIWAHAQTLNQPAQLNYLHVYPVVMITQKLISFFFYQTNTQTQAVASPCYNRAS